MEQTLIHYFLHIGFPFFIAFFFFRRDWKRTYAILLLTMLVDLDHVMADPLFQVNRCSIQFHPLHSYPAMIIYVFLLFMKRPFRIIGIGLLLHMLTDLIDCLMMFNQCDECMVDSPANSLLEFLHSILG